MTDKKTSVEVKAAEAAPEAFVEWAKTEYFDNSREEDFALRAFRAGWNAAQNMKEKP